jgi:imidazole glycerol-phosphate synthase subunit HisH
MSLDVVIVDYGMGNLGSVRHALSSLGLEAQISAAPADLDHADALILPGVGAFGEAMEQLRRRGLVEPLERHAVQRGKPFLGICLGMQLLAERSFEHGEHRGLGWLPGNVQRLPEAEVIVPHVGWSEVKRSGNNELFDGIDADGCFYFDHGYHLVTESPYVVATFQYGGPRVAAVRSGNLIACQFHPEKSQRSGLKLLRNFLRLCVARRNRL